MPIKKHKLRPHRKPSQKGREREKKIERSEAINMRENNEIIIMAQQQQQRNTVFVLHAR